MLNNQANTACGHMLASGGESMRPLARIGDAADRIIVASQALGEFLDRYHGPQAPAGTSAGETPICVTYSSNLERLFANIETLELRLQVLGEIG